MFTKTTKECSGIGLHEVPFPPAAESAAGAAAAATAAHPVGSESMKRPIRSEARLYRWVLDFLGSQRIIHRNFETW